MIVEIEFYKGDILLSGKQITYAEFLRQMNEIEADYDRIQDNFVALLCRRYDWTITEIQENPVYTYDRDIEKAYQSRRG
ncbi:MAG: hypothetical protein K2N95_14780 [Lachnospiraceae bacterium]|nr:hypothetical protein [Lachnospiraceae bacterium]